MQCRCNRAVAYIRDAQLSQLFDMSFFYPHHLSITLHLRCVQRWASHCKRQLLKNAKKTISFVTDSNMSPRYLSNVRIHKLLENKPVRFGAMRSCQYVIHANVRGATFPFDVAVIAPPKHRLSNKHE